MKVKLPCMRRRPPNYRAGTGRHLSKATFFQIRSDGQMTGWPRRRTTDDGDGGVIFEAHKRAARAPNKDSARWGSPTPRNPMVKLRGKKFNSYDTRLGLRFGPSLALCVIFISFLEFSYLKCHSQGDQNNRIVRKLKL